jgi:hypothetical protein
MGTIDSKRMLKTNKGHHRPLVLVFRKTSQAESFVSEVDGVGYKAL